MKVAVLMGSDSDWPILKPAVELLKQFGVEPVVKVASAHRTPSMVRDFVMEADHNKEFAAFIIAAGAAAHLAGVVASYTIKPVIGVPVNATPLNGMDALLSTVGCTRCVDGGERGKERRDMCGGDSGHT